ncbi:Uncharacterized protein NV38_0002509 [Leptospira kirschneri serovar Mozdok]|uniref:hypothetical protein n=1 Tax=Leptospira kirschneri TaxID=29507 RepID=UPI0002E0CBFD|nr:hypothetical protein [Leptospira kirschneri]KON76803.1 Uncharacterized protein NV38_0002509 [Leptospira kirschneri serovar Mozdok]NDK05856.1 hypothetical protein [Leptospira kirschneri serovar Mozdok]
MFFVCSLLTGAKEPGGCLWQAGFAPVFLRQTRVILSFETISYIVECFLIFSFIEILVRSNINHSKRLISV